MVDTAGCRVVSDGDGGLFACRPDGSIRDLYILGLPDLDDPATVGCLLALVRERWGDPSLAPLLIDGRWHIGAGSARSVHMYGATEGGVLVIALEAAP
jgi:hypothetical protein